MAKVVLINIGSCNGLLPGGIKPLPERIIIDWPLKNKLRLDFNNDKNVFPQVNVSENIW